MTMETKCDVCRVRPANVRVAATVNGERRILELCDSCYQQASAQRRPSPSPMESLFRGRPMDGLFDSFFGSSQPEGGAPERRATPRDVQESVDVSGLLSEQAKEMLQAAAQKAVEYGQYHVDTEHILYALLDGQVVERILKQFKISSDDLRGYIEHNAPRGDRAEDDGADLTVTPRVKSCLLYTSPSPRDRQRSRMPSSA